MPETPDDEVLPEYDFSKGIRGKYAKKYREGVVIIVDGKVVKDTTEDIKKEDNTGV
jgi:hypothetical protein